MACLHGGVMGMGAFDRAAQAQTVLGVRFSAYSYGRH